MIRLGRKNEAALSCHLEDLRPAQSTEAKAIIAGHYSFASGVADTGGYLPYGLETPTAAWQSDLHGFSWLRHFSAGDAEMAALARYYVRAWMAEKDWHPQAWTLPVITRRVISWLTNGRILTENIEDRLWQQQLRRSLIQQGKFILRRAGSTRRSRLNSDAQLSASVALALLGLSLSGYEHWLERGFALLKQEITDQILPDGGHISRNPSEHLSVLFDLLTLKKSLLDQGRPGPDKLAGAIDRMLPMLRFFCHGDGRLALFNGAVEEDSANLQAVLTHDDVRGRPFAFAPHSGYQRLLVGRTLLLMDTGAPPPGRFGQQAHAGCLSLEMSSGKQRFIVNCGSTRRSDNAWRLATRTTAAHSTLTLQNTSSMRRRRFSEMFGRNLNGPSQVDSHRNENQQGVWLDAGHDGYARNFDMVHRRRLFLKSGGKELRGEDVLQSNSRHKKRGAAQSPKSFAIRFHFHPDVRCGLTHNGRALIARLANGEGWMFKAQAQMRAGGALKSCVLQKQPSVYLGADKPRRCEQLVIEEQTAGGGRADEAAKINWLWRRIDHAA